MDQPLRGSVTADEMRVVEFRDEPPITFVPMKDWHRIARTESDFVAQEQRHVDRIADQELTWIGLTGIDHLNSQATIGIPGLFVTQIGDKFTGLPGACEEEISAVVDFSGNACEIAKS